jgi:hypothetical protein
MNWTCNCSVPRRLLYSMHRGSFTLNNQETFLKNTQSQKKLQHRYRTGNITPPWTLTIEYSHKKICSMLHSVDTFLFSVQRADMRHGSASRNAANRGSADQQRQGKKRSICFRRRGAVDDMLLLSGVKRALQYVFQDLQAVETRYKSFVKLSRSGGQKRR